MNKNRFTLEDLRDFDNWKLWKNGGADLEPLFTEKIVDDLLECQRGNSYVSVYNKTRDTDISSLASKAPEPWEWRRKSITKNPTNTNMIKTALIRFNTEFPGKGKKWRILDSEYNEIQVNEFNIEGVQCSSSSDVLPSGEIKHHVKVNYNNLTIDGETATFI